MNNNNNINNNINCNNNNMERVFWKVIHNKYIFRIILSFIPVVIEEISNNKSIINYKNYNIINNKCKFKYIHSLKWMIEYNQLQLLKCKLNANEYIEIYKDSLVSLFKLMGESPTTTTTISPKQLQQLQQFLLSKTTSSPSSSPLITNKKRKFDQDNNNENETAQDITVQPSTISKRTLPEEILQLLLDNKRVQIECLVDDILSLAIESNCLDVITILSNQSAPIQIYPSTIKTIGTIKMDKHTKLQIIYIFVNSNSYKSSQQQQQSLSTLFSQLQNETEENNITKVDKPENTKVNNEVDISTNSNNDCPIDWKILLERGEPICNISFQDVYSYCASELSGNALEYLIKLGDPNREFHSLPLPVGIEKLKKNQDSILKWIKLSTSQSIITFCLSKEYFGKQLIRLLCELSIISKQVYCEAVESIGQDYKKMISNRIPSWSPIIYSLAIECVGFIEIKDFEIIDWMICGEAETNLVKSSNTSTLNNLVFDSIELVDYLTPHIHKLGINIRCITDNLGKTYQQAIRKCDIQGIKEIDSRNNINFNYFVMDHLDFYKLFKDNPIENVEQLLNHWNSTNYKTFETKIGDKSKRKLSERLIYQQRNCGDGNDVNTTILKRIKLNLNEFGLKCYMMVIELIKINNFKCLSLVIDHHQFKFDETFYSNFKSMWKGGRRVQKYLYDTDLNVYRVDGMDVKELISYVQFWINQLNLKIGSSDFAGVKETISTILNHLYSTLIQIKFVKFQDIKLVRQMLSENLIEIKHSYFNSFNYLFIRSPLFIKFIMKEKDILEFNHQEFPYPIRKWNIHLPYVVEINTLRTSKPDNVKYFNGEIDQGGTAVGNLKALNFTFEFILGEQSNFDKILLKLLLLSTNFMDGTIHQYIINYNQDIVKEFLIDIGRLDLLFIHFQQTHQFKLKLTTPHEYRLVNVLNYKQMELVIQTVNDTELFKLFLDHEFIGINLSKPLEHSKNWFRAALTANNENFEIIKYLFDNYYQTSFAETLLLNTHYFDYNYLASEFIFSNYKDTLFPIRNSDIDSKLTNIFNSTFIHGDVSFCDLLLKYFSKHITISNNLISSAHNLGKFNIINHFITNGFIKDDHSDSLPQENGSSFKKIKN